MSSALEKLKAQKSKIAAPVSRGVVQEPETKKALKKPTAVKAVKPAPEDTTDIPSVEAIQGMKVKQLDALNASFPESLDGWEDMNQAGKIEAVIEALHGGDGQTYSEAPEEAAETDEEPSDELDAELAAPKAAAPKKVRKAKKADPDDLIEKSAAVIEKFTEEQADAEMKVISEDVEFNYFRLGGVLSVIKNNKYFGEYQSFREKVEAEYSMKYRKAEYLVSIYNNILESGIKWDQVKDIGWAKMKVISGILTPDNIEEWVEKASSMNRATLENEVKLLSSGDTDVETSAPVKDSSVSSLSFKVHTDQKDNINAALEKAMEESGTEVKTVALEHICLEYLSGGKKTAKVRDMTVKEMFQKLLKNATGDTPDDKLTSALATLLEGKEFQEVFGMPVSELDFSGN